MLGVANPWLAKGGSCLVKDKIKSVSRDFILLLPTAGYGGSQPPSGLGDREEPVTAPR